MRHIMTKAVDQTTSIQHVEPLLALFAFLVSLREEIRAERQRKLQRYADDNGLILVGDDGGRDFRFIRRPRRPDDGVDRAGNPLPVFVERNPRNGNLFFRLSPGARKRALPDDSTSAEFNRAYHAELARHGEQNDLNDWAPLEALYAAQRRAKDKAQRRGTANRGGQR
jgi:hypothetical protein